MRLLISRRFGPLFATQFLGAFNDNLYKNALVLLVLYQGFGAVGSPGVVVNLASGVFILPFFLLSASAGQWADGADKSRIARLTKWLELLIAMLGAAALVAGSLPLALAALALLGVQSALFGPVKYSVLPQYLAADELLAGNAWIEAATFLAILFGTLAAGALVAGGDAATRTGVLVLAVALLGLVVVHGMPAAPPLPGSRVDLHLLRATGAVLRWARGQPVWPVLLGISWFWAFGATVLTQLPILVREHGGGDAAVVSVLLAIFSIGIGAGSLLSAAVLRRWPTARPVPAAALAMALSAALWLLLVQMEAGTWAVAASLFALAAAGGAYCVPLYTALQRLAPEGRRGQAVAANNIVNSAAMVAAALGGGAALAAGLDAWTLLMVVTALNLPVAAWARGLPRLEPLEPSP